MTDIVPVKSTLDEIGKVCSRKKVDGKTVTGFNVWSPDVVRIMETICDGRYFINGFRNRDIGRVIFPEIKDSRKLSSKVSRTLKKLRQHGPIKKVPRSRRYHVTSKGHAVNVQIIFLFLELFSRKYHINRALLSGFYRQPSRKSNASFMLSSLALLQAS